MRKLLWVSLFCFTAWAQKYDGPRPPKKDVIYLVHADNLVPTETADAKDDSKKDEAVYSVPGANSPARTPVAEPIFLIQSEKVSAEGLELYRFDVKNGRREITLSSKRRSGPKALHLSVTRLDRGLYRVEAAEPLENGEYVLSPSGSNQVFCFAIY